ncbi:GNAT family N-acetyltransferase [Christiangramia crocea]|uniref:GNAT family N-acetyltransferase n=1 Tax=Christiangramia crocea TaxID=2904124 RepID=A0A9X2A5V3_9FLAO|nr:GNAT family N-acetyltransferase [Gramella crocea]MCG9970426.1 GNAT family N-acetyltransferase [Gramella crocea]
MKEDLIKLITEINLEFNGELIEESIEKYVNRLLGNAEVILQYSHEDLVGCIAFYGNDKKRKKGFISFIGVKKSYRDRGLGKILLDSSIAYLKNNDFRELGLEVIKNNEKALKFYHQRGFSSVEDREQRIFMIKKLL